MDLILNTKADDVSVDGLCVCNKGYDDLSECLGCGLEIEPYAVDEKGIHWDDAHWHLACAFNEIYNVLNYRRQLS